MHRFNESFELKNSWISLLINKYLDKLLYRNKAYYGERNSSKAMKLAGFRFWDAMYFIWSKVASSDQTCISASSLRLMLKNEFSKSEQHDANEFILYLFGKLQDEQTPKFAKFDSQLYKSGVDAWNGYSSQHWSIIDRLFTGMSQTNIECQSWGNISVAYDWFNHIHLSLSKHTQDLFIILKFQRAILLLKFDKINSILKIKVNLCE